MSLSSTAVPARQALSGVEEPLPKEVRRTLRASILEGSATTIFASWTGGAVLAAYLIHMGATPSQLAVAGSVPFLAQTSAPIGGWLLSLWPRPRRLTAILACLGRSLWILPALLPLFYLGLEGAVHYMILLMAMSWFLQASAGPVWSTWMSRVVPSERRGRYFGLRNGILAVVGLAANIAAGVILDAVGAPVNYQLLLLAGTIFALVGIALLKTHHEPPVLDPPRLVGLREMFVVPLRDRNFRRYLVLASAWTMSVLLGMTMFFPFLIQKMELPFTQIAVFQAIVALSVLGSGPLWGRLADKVGNKAVLTFGIFIAGTVPPACWILARPGDPTLIYLSGLLEGIAGGAIGAAMFNLALATAPERTRPAYLGVLAFVAGVAGFVGGVAAGPLLEIFARWEFAAGDVHWGAFQWLFLFSGIGRLGTCLLVRPVKETHAWRTRDVIRLFIPWRSLPFGWRG